MKHVTDYIEFKGLDVYSTYVYDNGKRTGCVRIGDCSVPTTGTFGVSMHGGMLVLCNYQNIALAGVAKNEDGSTSVQIQRVFETHEINYAHTIRGDTLYATGQGAYTETNMRTGAMKRHPYFCSEEQCMHEVLAIAASDACIYIGCDLGNFACIDAATHQVLYTRSFSGGVTWIKLNPRGYAEGSVEVGTYAGEYVVFVGQEEVARKALGSIIWRIYPVEAAGAAYNIVAQSYDGVSLFTEGMELVKNVPTDDLVYAVRMDSKSSIATGYNYYAGTTVHISAGPVQELPSAEKPK
ncbi:uncharacterized protein NEMAJ01_1133 [Nematocida major]|uniref:uncharacterized protein n=1 Tax=Nematocida major TaxID=1912982 RepID=UPI002007650A|nr:uncharacterized protein NEMAJ01_1133 [Nematocida major]KAH9386237.1 hypothetical protein NEMAJ01_1133 [Nematocida major]